MSGLFRGGLEVTAVHNHLNEMSPHVMYMHYTGHGDAVQLATALRQALAASGTPLGGAATAAALVGPGLDAKAIEQALGRSGRDIGGGVFQVTVPRAETITEMGLPLLPAMGVTTVMNFQPTPRQGGDHRRLRARGQGSDSSPRAPTARHRRDGDPQSRAARLAAALLHAFLGQRRRGGAGPRVEGGPRSDQ